MHMPPPDEGIIKRRGEIIVGLESIVGKDYVMSDPSSLKAYESDALTAYRQMPLLVVLPKNTAEVSRLLEFCSAEKIKIVPRGAGTGLSGGALPLADAITIGLGRFNHILEVDYDNRCAIVQPGVANLEISKAIDEKGFYYAPDPSSQIVCSIGGNVAENSGGVHCLKYGLTTNNLLGVEIVLMGGDIVRMGGKHFDSNGYDLMGLMTGSEGMLGIITEVTVRILPKPPLARALLIGFSSTADAGRCVAGIIGSGIIPAGLELMDRVMIECTEDFCHAGYPMDAEALLICELDGPEVEVEELVKRVERIAHSCDSTSARISKTEEERQRFWLGRKSAFPAASRIAPDYYVMDGTIPRGSLAEVLDKISELSQTYGLKVGNVFHAGDGNLHPLIFFDANIPGELERTESLGAEILKCCVDAGGVLTGEHGVGVEKRDLMGEMFTEEDLKQQQRVKCSFDADHLLNPGKVFPTLHRCAELGRMHVHKGKIPFPEIPRL